MLFQRQIHLDAEACQVLIRFAALCWSGVLVFYNKDNNYNGIFIPNNSMYLFPFQPSCKCSQILLFCFYILIVFMLS